MAALAENILHLELKLGLRQRGRKQADKAKLQLALDCIAANLIAMRWLAGGRPASALAVPRSNNTMWAASRYRPPVYGQPFLDVLSLLTRLGLISEGPRGYGFPNGDSRRSSVLITEAFNKCFPAAHFSLEAITRVEEPEVIVLKSPKGPDGRSEPIEYQDTAATKKMRQEVQAINGLLRAASLRLSEGARLQPTAAGQPIDPTRRSVRRVFNEGRFNAGGRLFGGYWMTMTKADRFRHLKIGTAVQPHGEPVASVDYGQLFPNLAYIGAGLQAPERDLYDVSGDGSCRDGWKTLINSLLFAIKPLRNWPREALPAFPSGTKLKDALGRLKAYHAPIADQFGTGVGFKLMWLESRLLLATLSELAAIGVTALPLHDAVLVASSEAECAKAVMEKAFLQLTGSTPARVSIDLGPAADHVGS
ncbi:hypothetical protein PY365_32700 [Roseiarcaceae bacterium H3SJ34-1]|uniref:hypothetical protein n=1 Tax=Terripilifer ovatus TaxID=3032367 RepID=UPI003AB9447A|nr:hypothetical protein [Roseiarcaceae bacterium H3SJ34-1]